MSRRIIILFIISLGATQALAQGFVQDSTRHFRLTFLIGYGSIASYDNFCSPLPNSGITAPIGGEIEYITPNVRHLFSVVGITSLGNAENLINQYSDNAENFNNVYYGFADIRYRFTHFLSDISSTTIHASVGGEWENMIFGRAYNYSSDFNHASGSGEFSSGLAAAADLTYAAGSAHHFTASFSLPLVAFVLRPAYGLINSNSSLFSYPSKNIYLEEKIEPIGTMWSWRIGLDYDYELSQVFLLGLHFHEFYYRYPMLLWKTVGAENDLTFAVTWRFNL